MAQIQYSAFSKIIYHPLSFPGTEFVWDNMTALAGNSNLALAAIKVASVTVLPLLDIVLITPYAMTVGNIINLTLNHSQYSIRQKVGACAAIAFGAFYLATVSGIVGILIGKGIALLGVKTGATSLVILGKSIKAFGEKEFAIGATPIIALCYELPKQLIRAVPLVCQNSLGKVAIISKWVFSHIG